MHSAIPIKFPIPNEPSPIPPVPKVPTVPPFSKVYNPPNPKSTNPKFTNPKLTNPQSSPTDQQNSPSRK